MSDLAWIGKRIPGDPRFVRLIRSGEVAMPALTTARARWEARQAEAYSDCRMRARMLLPILDQFVEETQGRFLGAHCSAASRRAGEVGGGGGGP